MSDRRRILERDMLRRAVYAYADAYKASDAKDPEERRIEAMRRALVAVHQAEREFLRWEIDAFRSLSEKQMDAVELLAEGLTYKQIALRAGSAESTIRTHLHMVYEKLAVRDRAEAVILFEKCRALLHEPEIPLP